MSDTQPTERFCDNPQHGWLGNHVTTVCADLRTELVPEHTFELAEVATDDGCARCNATLTGYVIRTAAGVFCGTYCFVKGVQ